jgi:hypothetical protein
MEEGPEINMPLNDPWWESLCMMMMMMMMIATTSLLRRWYFAIDFKVELSLWCDDGSNHLESIMRDTS